MCGIAGAWHANGEERASIATVRAMTAAIIHRGPDDDGIWSDPESGLVLGHRRLSILDLSPAGHQPMVGASGRYVIVFNGEIYNFRDLRARLENAGHAPAWRGHSDTEVLLAWIEIYGLRNALREAQGMFALALWDRKERVLSLARDRVGEKPLYYGQMGPSIIFGSELKALMAHRHFRREIDRGAMTAFMRYNYVPAPLSIWKGIQKLLPGHLVEISDQGKAIGEQESYWSMVDCLLAGAADPLPDTSDTVDSLELLLGDAVERQMVADVPLGAFLSGGIDSSLIVSLMQVRSDRPVRTFTIGFEEASHNEAERAKRIAHHLGTAHTEHYVSAADAQRVIPRLPAIYDEPFADSSQIPTLLVSEFARRHVKVSLSGDGGDELFGGYNRYVMGPNLFAIGQKLGPSISGVAAALIRSQAALNIFSASQTLLPVSLRRPGFRESFHKVADALESDSPQTLYRRFVSLTQDPAALVIGGHEPEYGQLNSNLRLEDIRSDMMCRDSTGYLPDDILVKVDRAAMATSLETRVPFLDPRVIEFASRLPMSAKFSAGQGKHILRQILDRHVPRELMNAPKSGFGVPIGRWLQHELHDWAADLLSVERIKGHGVFDPDSVQELWRQQCEGRPVHQHLWGVLMGQAWLDTYL